MRKAFLYCLFLFAGLGLFAETIDLEQARLLALANSRSLARYNMAIRSSVLDEKSQLYSMLPNLSADYSVTMNYLDWNFVKDRTGSGEPGGTTTCQGRRA